MAQEGAMAPSESETPVQSADEPWVILRPPELLMDLPVAYRWEVTRRHPYYLRFWQLAQSYHGGPSTDPGQRGLEESAALVLLGALGVSAPLPPPGASADSLGAGSLSNAWEGGAVAPVPYRGLLGMLLTHLPPEVLVQVGHLLADCGARAGPEKVERLPFLTELFHLQHPALDALPTRPVVGVNVHAPLRAITEAVETMARQWKEGAGIAERRRREDKLDDYLAAWDLREGWAGDRYDGSREQTLCEIAQRLQVPLSTAANRYRSAFGLIVGRAYTPALWARVIGAIKAYERLGPEGLPRRTLRRPWRSPQPRAVPEAALRAPGEGAGAAGPLNTIGASPNEIAYTDLVLDIQDLIARGRSNADIIAALEMTSSDAADLVEYLRQRRQDQL
jgi:hypothetical protein